MHQKCYGFYWSIKKRSKLDQKLFLGHLESFFVYDLLHPIELHPKILPNERPYKDIYLW